MTASVASVTQGLRARGPSGGQQCAKIKRDCFASNDSCKSLDRPAGIGGVARHAARTARAVSGRFKAALQAKTFQRRYLGNIGISTSSTTARWSSRSAKASEMPYTSPVTDCRTLGNQSSGTRM